MYCPIDEGKAVKEVDIFFNQDGGITFEPHYLNEESTGAYQTTVETLVTEFLDHQRNGETGRVENAQAMPLFTLLDALNRSIRLVEEALYED